ncbi:MAG: NfeD family protein [Oscillospiraceae bacterium]|nr:NfeD family protein [Oscillospiraceae bacterium]
MWEYIFWGVLFVFLLLAEAATTVFISIWLAAGALISFFLAVFGASFTVQCVVFVIVSLVLFIITRPLVSRLKGSAHVATNSDSLIGMEGIVCKEIGPLENGRVRVSGLDWSARSVDGGPVAAGARITVEKIEGATLLVRPADPAE